MVGGRAPWFTVPRGFIEVLLPWDDGFLRASIKVLSGARNSELSGLDMYFDGSKAERESGMSARRGSGSGRGCLGLVPA